MSNISDEVNVSVSAADAKVQRAGFGLPLILSFTAAWTERTREYTSAAGVLVDFPATGAKNTPEYLMASAVFAQNPRPPKLVIGRCALPPTQKFEITPVVVNSHVYSFNFDGNLVTYTSDGTATAAEITAGLKTALDALSLAVTSSQQNANATLRIVANAAGAWFNYGSIDRTNMPVVQNHADPGLATDLAAIAVERNDWYFVLCAFNSDLVCQAIAAYANTNKQAFVFQTIDTVVPGTAKSGTDDVCEFLQNAANDYAWPIFKSTCADFADCAWVGARAPTTPGTETWKFITLAGVPADTFTQTERTNMRAKNCNFYENTGGVNMTEEGYASSGRYMDLVRYIDAARADIAERCFADLVAAGQLGTKIGYDDTGIGVFQAEVLGKLKTDAGLRILDKASIQVNVPLLKNVSSADKTSRTLNNVTFSALYTGAIHKANITGQLSV